MTPTKTYPNAALDACVQLLREWNLTTQQIANLALDLPGECESINAPAHAPTVKIQISQSAGPSSEVEPAMKFHPDVLAAHAQFGGDLEDMQRRYDATMGSLAMALAFTNEWLKRKIDEDGDEGEIGAGFEMLPLPELQVEPAEGERDLVIAWLGQNAKHYADLVATATGGMKAPVRAQAALCVQLQRDIRAGAHLNQPVVEPKP